MTIILVILHTVVLGYWQDFIIALKEHMLEEVRIGDIGSVIAHAIEPKILWTLDLFGWAFPISDAALVTFLVLPVIWILAWLMGRKPVLAPSGGRQLIAESLVQVLLDLCKNAGMSYEQAEKVVPFIGSTGIFITLTNLTSMLKIPPPAKNPAFPIAMALLTIAYVIATSIRFVGLRGFWQSLIYPKNILLPFKLLDFVIKPMSLALRLFGNVFGAFILMEFIFIVVPILLPGVIGLWFDLADGILQGIIFTYLSATYIGEIVESAHEAAEAAKAARGTAHKKQNA